MEEIPKMVPRTSRRGNASFAKRKVDVSKLGTPAAALREIRFLKGAMARKMGWSRTVSFVRSEDLERLKAIADGSDENPEIYAEWWSALTTRVPPDKLYALVNTIEDRLKRRTDNLERDRQYQAEIEKNVAAGTQIVAFRGKRQREDLHDKGPAGGLDKSENQDAAREVYDLAAEALLAPLLPESVISSVQNLAEAIGRERLSRTDLPPESIAQLSFAQSKLESLLSIVKDLESGLFDNYTNGDAQYSPLEPDLKEVLIRQFGLSAQMADEIRPAVEGFIRGKLGTPSDIPRATSSNGEPPALPQEPPKYAFSPDLAGGIEQYLRDNWLDYIGRGLLTRPALRRIDPLAYKAYANWLRTHEPPPELKLLTISEALSRERDPGDLKELARVVYRERKRQQRADRPKPHP